MTMEDNDWGPSRNDPASPYHRGSLRTAFYLGVDASQRPDDN